MPFCKVTSCFSHEFLTDPGRRSTETRGSRLAEEASSWEKKCKFQCAAWRWLDEAYWGRYEKCQPWPLWLKQAHWEWELQNDISFSHSASPKSLPPIFSPTGEVCRSKLSVLRETSLFPKNINRPVLRCIIHAVLQCKVIIRTQQVCKLGEMQAEFAACASSTQTILCSLQHW